MTQDYNSKKQELTLIVEEIKKYTNELSDYLAGITNIDQKKWQK